MRRSARRFGRKGGPFQKRRLSWVTTIFNESAQDRGGNITERNLLISSDWQGNEAALQKTAHVKRILVNGGLACNPEITATAQDLIALFGAIYVIDVDDTDATILSVASGTILQGCRVLKTDAWAWGSTEAAGVVENTYGHFIRFQYDIRLNVTLQADQAIVFALQFGSDVTSTIIAAAACFYSRILIEQP